MPIRSLQLGLFGKADVIEFIDGVPLPVEFKRGKLKMDGSDRVQFSHHASAGRPGINRDGVDPWLRP